MAKFSITRALMGDPIVTSGLFHNPAKFIYQSSDKQTDYPYLFVITYGNGKEIAKWFSHTGKSSDDIIDLILKPVLKKGYNVVFRKTEDSIIISDLKVSKEFRYNHIDEYQLEALKKTLYDQGFASAVEETTWYE